MWENYSGIRKFGHSESFIQLLFSTWFQLSWKVWKLFEKFCQHCCSSSLKLITDALYSSSSIIMSTNFFLKILNIIVCGKLTGPLESFSLNFFHYFWVWPFKVWPLTKFFEKIFNIIVCGKLTGPLGSFWLNFLYYFWVWPFK